MKDLEKENISNVAGGKESYPAPIDGLADYYERILGSYQERFNELENSFQRAVANNDVTTAIAIDNEMRRILQLQENVLRDYRSLLNS